MPKKPIKRRYLQPEHQGNVEGVTTMRHVMHNKAGLTDAQDGGGGDVSLKSLPIAKPAISAKGGSGNSCWVILVAPVVAEDLDRVYCELSYNLVGGTKFVIDTGDTEYPLDGSSFYISGLPTGRYDFSAFALWSDASSDTQTEANVQVP